MVVEFELPCYVTIGSKTPRKISLTMNWYRNSHHYESNDIKQYYWPVRGERFKAQKIAIDYTLYLSNNRKTDLMNWISIADKFFLDWLTATNCIPDDDVSHYLRFSARSEKSTDKRTYIIARVEIIE